jgi:HK97 gp10 family phage protein
VSRVEIRIDGLDDLFADLRKLGDLSDELLVDTINDVAMDTQNEAVRGIQRGPANGRTYKRGTVTHTASAPGQFPMSDTGRLASNVESILATPANIQAKVGTNIVYGAYLEFGTSKMAARPWLQRSFRQAAEGVAKELKAKLEARI